MSYANLFVLFTSSTNLIDWCGQTFSHAVMAVYEQIRPSDGFGLVMQRHFNQLCIPLLSLPVHPGKADQQRRFLSKGYWADCSVYDMNEFWDRLVPIEERQRVQHLEDDFDEYEGFHEKCSHYIILTASKGSCRSPLPMLEDRQLTLAIPGAQWKLTDCSVLRYGQAGVVMVNSTPSLDRHHVFLSGGFGSRPGGQHGRLGDLFVIAGTSMETKVLDKRLARVYHSMDPIGDDTFVIFGGRTHPRRPLRDIGLHSVRQNQLKWLEPSMDEERTIWPEARWRHASCSISPGELLICGGRTCAKVMSDCWKLSIREESDVRWTRFLSLPAGRHSASVSSWKEGGLVILFGGLDAKESECRPDCLTISMTEPDGWNQVEWNGPSPLPRYSHRALQHDERLILVGGIGRLGIVPGVCVIQMPSWTCVEYSLPVRYCQRMFLPSD